MININSEPQSLENLKFISQVCDLASSPLTLESITHRLAQTLLSGSARVLSLHLKGKEGQFQTFVFSNSSDNQNLPQQKLLAQFTQTDPAPEYSQQKGPKQGDEPSLTNWIRSRETKIFSQISSHELRHLSAGEEHFSLLSTLSPSSAVLIPLFSDDREVGAISLMTTPPQTGTPATEIPYLEGLCRVITQQIQNSQRLQEAISAVTLREDLLFFIAHELRNPIQAHQLQIESISHLLDLETLSEQNRRKLKTLIQTSSKNIGNLSSLIDALFDAGTLASGKIMLRKKEVELLRLIEDAVSDISQQVGSASSLIRISGNPAVKGFWDPVRIKQVLINLLSNAIKYGNRKPVTVLIQPNSTEVRIQVQDQGIGIQKEYLDKIFEKFHRIQSGDSRRSLGLGLGLYITKQIVTAHQGKIEVESVFNHCSQFTVVLPLEVT